MFFKRAIVIIHGFAGGTYDQEYLAHRLELIWNYDVYQFTLAGHDGLFKSNMTKNNWIKSVDNMMEFLIENGYRTVYIIGHSMGGVLATYSASKYKCVKKLVLVAAAFKFIGYKNNTFCFFNSLKNTHQIIKDYSKNEILTRITKMPIGAISEFTNLVNNNIHNLSLISIPTLIIQGNCDELVPLNTADFIYNRIKSYKKIIIFDNVNHDVFRSNKKNEITNEIISFLKNKN